MTPLFIALLCITTAAGATEPTVDPCARWHALQQKLNAERLIAESLARHTGWPEHAADLERAERAVLEAAPIYAGPCGHQLSDSRPPNHARSLP